MALLTELKQYLRLEVEDGEEDIFLSSLIAAATSYIKTATTKDVDEANALHTLAVFLLCTHWYDNRNTVLIGQAGNELGFSLRAILTQIEWSD